MLQPEEVVEVFIGDTLEEAMAYAVAALGPDLSVRRARKVRKGVQGLVGRDRYEVVAVPAPVAADALGSAFDALLSQAEAAEAPPARRTTRPHPSPEVGDHAPLLAQPELTRVTPLDAPAPRAAVEAPYALSVVDPEPLDETPARLEPVPALAAAPALEAAAAPVAAVSAFAPAAAPKAKKPAVRKRSTPKEVAPGTEMAVVPSKRTPVRRKAAPAAPTGWSRAALVELGLPAAVLDALPAEDPHDDLAWVVALAVALSAVLPAPGALGEDNPLVVNGYGMAGVLGLLDAASRGLTPGTITVGERTAAATATELALAVRTAVVG